MSVQPAARPAAPALPDIPAVCAAAGKAVLLTEDGEIETLPPAQAAQRLQGKPVLVCHAPYTRQRLGLEELWAFDVLELFAFTHPARFCVPTPHGLAKALGLSLPESAEDYPLSLMEAARALLSDLRAQKNPEKILEIAGLMGLQGKGWAWSPFVFSALGAAYDPALPVSGRGALNVWKDLPQWAEDAPEPPPAHYPVTGEEARERLAQALGPDAERRPQQMEYATELTAAFAPLSPRAASCSNALPSSSSLPPSGSHSRPTSPLGRGEESPDAPPPPCKGGGREGGKKDEEEGKAYNSSTEPRIVLAEAGTGVGKTLGYLAPASVWAEKNGGAVWISTYTKNLQRQIEQELARLYPNPDLRETKIAVRKGRENYLCLLNLEESAAGAGLARSVEHAVAAGIMARWTAATKDGDLTGSDFPGWLPGLLGYRHTTGLADRRGECIYAACDHYHRCFVERSARKAERAAIVVANHALVMARTAQSGPDSALPRRYVFDEGHHLFDAADSAFAGHLTATETRELRRWILGNEGGKGRARGLKRRAEELAAGDTIAEAALQSVQHAAHGLTNDGWSKRLKSGMPSGPAETFLHLVYQQIQARSDGREGPYSLETQTQPLIDGLADAAQDLKRTLKDIHKPLAALAARMRRKLGEDNGDLSADTRRRLDSVAGSIELRSLGVAAWIAMLDTLEHDQIPEQFVDWMEADRIEGQSVDVGLYRHYVDPVQPFAAAILPHAHGIAVTSATLRDSTGDGEADWRTARERTGADYLSHDPKLAAVPSPFDYAAQTRVFVLTDVRKDDLSQVAGAYRALFEAAGGGALGLFTAISRLRAVHGRIAGALEERGIPLYAQHVDAMDNGTLVDVFRDDVQSCLLGTDAVRDGVDVPGDSLRLLVYDRVPWPRPTILHKARREAFGGRRYDDLITRLKIKQAYGRLIRRASDRGVFVILDSMLPTKLCGAFPETVEIRRAGLAEAVAEIRAFLSRQDGISAGSGASR